MVSRNRIKSNTIHTLKLVKKNTLIFNNNNKLIKTHALASKGNFLKDFTQIS